MPTTSHHQGVSDKVHLNLAVSWELVPCFGLQQTLRDQLGLATTPLCKIKEAPLYWPEWEKDIEGQRGRGLMSGFCWSFCYFLSRMWFCGPEKSEKKRWNMLKLMFRRKTTAGFAFVELRGWHWWDFQDWYWICSSSLHLCFQPRWTCLECVLCWLPALWPLRPGASSRSSIMLLGFF